MAKQTKAEREAVAVLVAECRQRIQKWREWHPLWGGSPRVTFPYERRGVFLSEAKALRSALDGIATAAHRRRLGLTPAVKAAERLRRLVWEFEAPKTLAATRGDWTTAEMDEIAALLAGAEVLLAELELTLSTSSRAGTTRRPAGGGKRGENLDVKALAAVAALEADEVVWTPRHVADLLGLKSTASLTGTKMRGGKRVDRCPKFMRRWRSKQAVRQNA